jgi:O-antigen ligase
VKEILFFLLLPLLVFFFLFFIEAGFFAAIMGLFAATFAMQLWAGRSFFYPFLLLSVLIPLFPDVGISFMERNLNWFDCLFLLIALWHLAHLFQKLSHRKWDYVLSGSAIFLIILLLLVFRSPDQAIAARDYISYMVNFFLVYWVMDDFTEADICLFTTGGLLSSFLVSLVALYQKMNNFTFASAEDGAVSIRLGVPGTFNDSLILSMYAGFMIMLALMAFSRYKHTGLRLIFGLCLLANFLSLRLALSRNGMFIVGVSVFFLLCFRFASWLRNRKKAWRIPLVLCFGPLILSFGLFLLPTDVYYRITSVLYLYSGSTDPVIQYNIRSTLGRFENYREALRLFVQNPVEGVGLGMYRHVTKFEDADGFYPGLVAETGLIGVTGFCFFAAGVLLLLYGNFPEKDSRLRFYAEIFVSVVIALFLVSFFEPVFKVQVMSFYFFFYLRTFKGIGNIR